MSESVCVWVVECFTLVGPLKVPVGITGTGYVDCHPPPVPGRHPAELLRVAQGAKRSLFVHVRDDAHV